MSKRSRLAIVIITLAVCYIFLYPTLKWYFWTPPEDKQLALGTREQIRDDAANNSAKEYDSLLSAAKADAPLPENLKFLLKDAKNARKARNMKAPEVWDAKAVLFSFEDRNVITDILETRERNRIFALKDTQKNAVQLGLDLSGGLSIILQADLNSYAQKVGHQLSDADKKQAMQQVLEVLNSRIDKFGLTEPVIRQQGDDQVYVEIPGNADPERINSIIMGKGSLSFQIVNTDATQAFNNYYAEHKTDTFDKDGKLINPSIIPADCEVLGAYGKDQYGLDVFQNYLVVQKEIGLDGTHIKSASVTRNNVDNKPEVIVNLDSEGGDQFYKLTSANVGKPLAIVLDDKVRSYPRINDAIHDNVSITGFDMDEANNLALILRTASLPVELQVVNQQTIGASLGADYIRQGLFALLGGLAVVFIFMLAFYKAAGINAVIAQLLNIYIMFSVLSAFNFTLTLPSIAGFILTVGMAVDANVIIFERMKEELRLGKTRKAVVEAGFSKAFWAIMDSNITTFIAAIFLSQLGSGSIQGFAVSLAIGVFSSVYTALFVSRLIFDFGTDTLHSKKVSVSWAIKEGVSKKGGKR